MATISNNMTDTIIAGTNRADFIYNAANTVTIDGGAGNDDIGNNGNEVSITGGAGKDSIRNEGSLSTIDGGIGNDTIDNSGGNVSINGNDGNDLLINGIYHVYKDDCDEWEDIIFGYGVSMNGGTGDDTIRQYGSEATLDGGAGNDYIVVAYHETTTDMEDTTIISVGGSQVSINGGEGNDTICVEGFENSISGGKGDDIVSLANAGNLIEYSSGDGNDTIYGFKGIDSLNIAEAYSTEISGNDVLVEVGDGSILLKDAKGTAFVINDNVEGDTSVDLEYIKLSAGNDTFQNIYAKVSIDAGAGDDYIFNRPFGMKASINGGDGNDSINNGGFNMTIEGGKGDDTIYNWGASVSIDGGDGNDSIYSEYEGSITLDGGAGDDTIEIESSNTVIQYNAGDGNDSVVGFDADDTLQIGDGTGTYSTLKSGEDIIVRVGNGLITLSGAASLSNVNIDGEEKNTVDTAILMLTDGNDTLKNTSDGAKILALDGNDSIRIYGDKVSLDAGAGDDSIRNYGDNVTICGGIGNDTIRNAFGEHILFDYNANDGSDVIIGFNDTSTLQIGGGTGIYSTTKSGNNIIVSVGSEKLTLAGAAQLNTLNIVGTKKTYKTLSITDKSSSKITLPATYNVVSGSKRTKAIKITGNALDNTISGGIGNDTLLGGAGSDSLLGSDGNDKLYGGTGDDILFGGAGNDSLCGQSGADKYIYVENTGKDVIFGFDDMDMLEIIGEWMASVTSTGNISFKVGSTYNSVVLKSFTATNFNVNGETYQIIGNKFVQR